MLSSDEIVSAIRSGRCRKISVPGFQNISYFADPDGNIYSLNNPTEPKFIDPKQGKGLMWVTLFEQEGLIRKLMVGDVIAHTFLANAPHDEAANTVLYKDGDPTNNAVYNLEWASVQEQQRQLRDHHLEKANGKEQPAASGRSGSVPDGDDEVPFAPPPPEADPLLAQLHALQKRLETAERRAAALRDALAPFAMFRLAPAAAAGLGKTVVVEANRGGNQHSVLTVQDFRKAKEVFEKRNGDDS